MRRFTPVTVLAAAALAIAASQSTTPAPVTVHEWGTFTSIAGEDGGAVQWTPLGGTSDLPCFVEQNGLNLKIRLSGTVRMETPVIYFYSPRDTSVSVRVRFPEGAITEWFPHALAPVTLIRGGAISWPDVRIAPRQPEQFPTESGPSHYYTARQTDAAPVVVGRQVEKFLFYRGVGQFAPPISAAVQADGRTIVSTADGTPVGDVILFENRRGAIAYDVRHVATGRATLERPILYDAPSTLRQELIRILIAQGLYPKEAEAMVDTWSDSWFEEGARLLYFVPRAAVDRLLPLEIAPSPAQVARVFVGRMELVTPVTRSAVRLALATNDQLMLERYGRFLAVIGGRVIAEASPLDRETLTARLQQVPATWLPPPACR